MAAALDAGGWIALLVLGVLTLVAGAVVISAEVNKLGSSIDD
jgi:uncharacterized membrane protein HdeD (DUF308 family)